MKLHEIISKLVTKIKGEEFILDANIPISYVTAFMLRKFVYLLNGYLKLGHIAYIAPKSIFRCVKKIKVGSNFNVERSCYIDALSRNGITLGSNVSIGKCTVIECTGSLKEIGYGMIVGNNVGLGSHGFFGCAGGVRIGNDVIFGNFVSLHSENHNYHNLNKPIRLQGVNRQGIVIGNDCWIGAKVTILDGAVIGDGCIVAAGAVVRGVFPNNVVIGGVPAKILKYRE